MGTHVDQIVHGTNVAWGFPVDLAVNLTRLGEVVLAMVLQRLVEPLVGQSGVSSDKDGGVGHYGFCISGGLSKRPGSTRSLGVKCEPRTISNSTSFDSKGESNFWPGITVLR